MALAPDREYGHEAMGTYYAAIGARYDLALEEFKAALAAAPRTARLDVRSMVTVDRQGVEQPLSREDLFYGEPRVSPDGKLVVMRIGESADIGHVWVYDVGAASLTPLTTDKRSLRPEWSRDGARIITTDVVSADSILVQSWPWDAALLCAIVWRSEREPSR